MMERMELTELTNLMKLINGGMDGDYITDGMKGKYDTFATDKTKKLIKLLKNQKNEEEKIIILNKKINKKTD